MTINGQAVPHPQSGPAAPEPGCQAASLSKKPVATPSRAAAIPSSTSPEPREERHIVVGSGLAVDRPVHPTQAG